MSLILGRTKPMRRFAPPLADFRTRLSPPMINLSAPQVRIIRWLKVLALILLPYLILQLVYTFQHYGVLQDHDEAEHLHVVYALERGERPYLDFIENHPTLFHLFLLSVKRAFAIDSPLQMYLFAKAVVYAHFIGCVALLFIFLQRATRSWDLPLPPAVALVLVLSFFTPWDIGNALIWELRPDWICYFYALLCVLGHLAFHFGPLQGRIGVLLAAAISGGLAAAVMAKSVYIFLPYGIAFTLHLLSKTTCSEMLVKDWQRLLITNALFLCLGLIAFAAMVSAEVWLTATSYSAYFKANYALNSIKHIPHPVAAIDNNPFNHWVAMTGLGLAGAIGMILLIGRRLLSSHENRRFDEFHVLVFLLLAVLINGLMPAYSNGLTWSHYFAPSLLALIFLGCLTLNDVIVWLIPKMVRAWNEVLSILNLSAQGTVMVRAVAFGVALSWVLVFVMLRYFLAFEEHRIINQANERYGARAEAMGIADSPPNMLLPPDLTYLTFSPQSKPVQARAWGYYFMLGGDTGTWLDVVRLGLGPDPETYWPQLYRHAPPDVILISDKYDYWHKMSTLNNSQGLKMDWLGQTLEKDYVCMRRTENNLQIQVARRWITRFEKMGWAPCRLRLN